MFRQKQKKKKIQFSKGNENVMYVKCNKNLAHLAAAASSFYRLASSTKDAEVGPHITTVDDCDLLSCDNEPTNDNGAVVCAVSSTGAVATFRSECGVKLLNCYQRHNTAATYRIISRKACAHKKVLFLRGHCDKLICESNGQEPEKRVCATNGDSIGLFKSACHIEVLNCYQRMYRKPSKDKS